MGNKEKELKALYASGASPSYLYRVAKGQDLDSKSRFRWKLLLSFLFILTLGIILAISAFAYLDFQKRTQNAETSLATATAELQEASELRDQYFTELKRQEEAAQNATQTSLNAPAPTPAPTHTPTPIADVNLIVSQPAISAYVGSLDVLDLNLALTGNFSELVGRPIFAEMSPHLGNMEQGIVNPTGSLSLKYNPPFFSDANEVRLEFILPIGTGNEPERPYQNILRANPISISLITESPSLQPATPPETPNLVILSDGPGSEATLNLLLVGGSATYGFQARIFMPDGTEMGQAIDFDLSPSQNQYTLTFPIPESKPEFLNVNLYRRYQGSDPVHLKDYYAYWSAPVSDIANAIRPNVYYNAAQTNEEIPQIAVAYSTTIRSREDYDATGLLLEVIAKYPENPVPNLAISRSLTGGSTCASTDIGSLSAPSTQSLRWLKGTNPNVDAQRNVIPLCIDMANSSPGLYELVFRGVDSNSYPLEYRHFFLLSSAPSEAVTAAKLNEWQLADGTPLPNYADALAGLTITAHPIEGEYLLAIPNLPDPAILNHLIVASEMRNTRTAQGNTSTPIYYLRATKFTAPTTATPFIEPTTNSSSEEPAEQLPAESVGDGNG